MLSLSSDPHILKIHEDEGTVCIVSVYYHGDFYLISWDKILEEASLVATMNISKKLEQKDMNEIANVCKTVFDEKTIDIL